MRQLVQQHRAPSVIVPGVGQWPGSRWTAGGCRMPSEHCVRGSEAVARDEATLNAAAHSVTERIQSASLTMVRGTSQDASKPGVAQPGTAATPATHSTDRCRRLRQTGDSENADGASDVDSASCAPGAAAALVDKGRLDCVPRQAQRPPPLDSDMNDQRPLRQHGASPRAERTVLVRPSDPDSVACGRRCSAAEGRFARALPRASRIDALMTIHVARTSGN